MAGPPPIDRDEVARRFRHYPPPDEARTDAHVHVRSTIAAAAGDLADALPEGREKSLAITALEEAMFWANASVARQIVEP